MKVGDIVYYNHAPGNETDHEYNSNSKMVAYSKERIPLVIERIVGKTYARCRQKYVKESGFSYHPADLILASDDESFLSSLYEEEN